MPNEKSKTYEEATAGDGALTALAEDLAAAGAEAKATRGEARAKASVSGKLDKVARTITRAKATARRSQALEPPVVQIQYKQPDVIISPLAATDGTDVLTADEIAERERERDQIVASIRARAGAATAPVVPDAAPDADAEPEARDVDIDPLRAVALVPAQKEREYVRRVRAENMHLAVEAQALFEEFQALDKEWGPKLGAWRALKWSLIGDTLRLAGKFGGTTSVDIVRRQVEDLAGALARMGSHGNDLSMVPKQIRALTLYDIRDGRIPALTQVVSQQRGGAAQLHQRLERVAQLMSEMSAALEGLPVPTPVLEGTRNPWPRAVARERQSRLGITEFNPLTDERA